MEARIYSLGLKVVDYPKMKAFYAETLGFPVARAFEDRADHKACFFALEGSPFYIVWDAPKDGEPAPPAKIRIRLDLHVPDIQKAWEEISAKIPGANGPPHNTRWGGFGFSIKDPESTTIHILQGKK